MNIKYNENVMGCRIEDTIFIHPDLINHEKLFSAVLKHEFEHTDGWGIQDVKHDLFGEGLQDVKKDIFKFIISHPKTLLGYLPLTKVEKYWVFDIQLAIIWALAASVGVFLGVFL